VILLRELRGRVPGRGVFQTVRFDELPLIELELRKNSAQVTVLYRRCHLSEFELETRVHLIDFRIQQMDRDDLYRRVTAFNLRGAAAWLSTAQVKPERTALLEFQSMIRGSVQCGTELSYQP
jgi:hypothetical protein